MNLLQMSTSGGILILAVIVLRAIFINRVPKGTFLALWGIAILRLLLPFSVPSAFSVYAMTEAAMEAFGVAIRDGDSYAEQREADGMAGSGMQKERDGADGGSEGDGWDFADMENSHAENAGTESGYRNGNAAFAMSESGQPAEGDQADRTDREGSDNREEGKSSGRMWIEDIAQFPGWTALWCAGAVLCAAYFGASGLYLRKKFRTAVLLRDEFLTGWLSGHRLRRQISVRCSDRIEAPMTYGILRPVILLPRKMVCLPSANPADLQRQNEVDSPQKQVDLQQRNIVDSPQNTANPPHSQTKIDTRQLALILQHEYVHIRRYDTLTKLIAAAALCVHWFNPLVWIMYSLFNRDLELACDESVVRQLGVDGRKAYALTLIDMEERKSGLSPVCNGFSKNAIEERITAIMKIKKITFGAVLLATLLVASVATVFATSAMERNQREQSITVPGLDYTQEEWEKLSALRFDGYEDMSVSEFQSKAWTLMERPEYRDTIERFLTDDTLYGMRDSNETASFLFYALEPLTAEKWKLRSFGGSMATEYPGAADNAALEYSLTLIIWDADHLTVGEYCDARLGISEDLRDWLLGRTAEELQDVDLMWNLMCDDDSGEIPRLTEKWDSESLGIHIEPFYTPLENAHVLDEEGDLNRMLQSERQAQWDEVLAPYVKFGVTYEYDRSTDDFKLYFQGKEIRGIVDEEEGLWISEHMGISKYARDAVELYAVYEDGELTGLREATEEEQKEWSEQRQRATDSLQTGGEEARGTPGTQEDYLSLLSLMTADYKDMPLTRFNQALLAWANENYDRMERIGADAAWNDIQVPLREDELSFVTLTVVLSGLENSEHVRRNQRGLEQDLVYDQYLPDKLAVDGGMGAWCSLYYQFSYHIDDTDAVTVGERDRCIQGMMEDVQEFWQETDIQVMLQMEEEDVAARLQEIAAKWSNEHIAVSIREDYVGFERMDERNLDFD